MLQKMKTKSIFKVRNLKSPRVIKTHLALDMLPNQACVFIVLFFYSIKLKYSMPGSLVPLTIFLNIIFNINPQVLEKKVKVIYVTRNPRDAVVCFFPLHMCLLKFTESENIVSRCPSITTGVF